ncbi:MAG TPA: TrpR like protein, YerC/YecD [Rhodospirillaceae bacterium]|nr:TrpR like protein, YerC/YecD [Rhodospirillaceae bacterium]
MPETRHTRGPASGRKPKDNATEKDLFTALVSLKDTEECRRFLHDLCTPKEISDMAERWWVARLLNEGELSYRDIHAMTGVSVTTIGRVARFLEQENYKGYKLILGRLGK